VISVFFLICAILVFCLKTHPGLRVADLPELRAALLLNQSSSPSPSQTARASSNPAPAPPEPTAKPFFKYRTEAIGADPESTKPHPSFLVRFGLKISENVGTLTSDN
jgi:hypothetical protein